MKTRWEHAVRYWPAYLLMAAAVAAIGGLLVLAILALPLIVLAFPLTIAAISLVVLIGWGRRRLQRRARSRESVT